jgi:hypothetical protein
LNALSTFPLIFACEGEIGRFAAGCSYFLSGPELMKAHIIKMGLCSLELYQNTRSQQLSAIVQALTQMVNIFLAPH